MPDKPKVEKIKSIALPMKCLLLKDIFLSAFVSREVQTKVNAE